ncbi:MAG TPA: acido-empty-quinoprotein group A [Bryobacteraceae bacterium]|jgi:alcohol dehydrogenase (cytochrome c)
MGGQGLDPAAILKPLPGTWPTYNGDYSGRRFSSLKQIDAANVRDLRLAWLFHAESGPGGSPFGTEIKSTPLEVDGVLYFTVPDNAWAIDARTGRNIWHYQWTSKGGIHTGNRGVGIYHNWLFFETPDNHLISLEKDTGKFRWAVEIADLTLEYFSTPAPLVIGNHILVGVGGDSLDVPGFLEARDPETGAVQWHWNTEPRKKGDPGSETWPDEQSMTHGGGMTWLTGTYDPELNLLYWGTGNPNPVHAGQGRKGHNLWTCSIVALNPDTGKLVWWFQASPHDTHDWDNVEEPVLFDAEIGGQKRKLLAQAARNGYFFVLDRTNGKNIVSVPFIDLNWSKGVDARGEPIPNPAKQPQTDGALVIPDAGGGTNWPPPSFDPETGLFYVSSSPSYAVYYLTDTSPHPEGYGGRDSRLWAESVLRAVDCKTGKIRWSHTFPGEGASVSGILTTAGKLLFTGDPSANFIAFDPATGKILWHAGLTASLSNGPMTYELDGRQYIVAGAGDMLYAFTLPN